MRYEAKSNGLTSMIQKIMVQWVMMQRVIV